MSWIFFYLFDINQFGRGPLHNCCNFFNFGFKWEEIFISKLATPCYQGWGEFDNSEYCWYRESHPWNFSRKLPASLIRRVTDTCYQWYGELSTLLNVDMEIHQLRELLGGLESIHKNSLVCPLNISCVNFTIMLVSSSLSSSYVFL